MLRRKADRHGGQRDAVTAGQTLKKPHRPQERWMAVGLGLDKSFPIGAQEMSTYSINGHAKNFNDISPSAYLQYYLNDDLMLRARITPYKSQYIKSSSIDSAYDSLYTSSTPSNYAPFQVVVLKKLFYADLTLTIHQRIWKGLWLGAGVDYSRLTGGAAIQNVIMVPLSGQTPDTIYRSETGAITGPGYAKISKSDWRGILEAEYVWRRLRVGVSYQQALTSYLPALADGSKSNNKNSSLSIHLSYDLWEPKRH